MRRRYLDHPGQLRLDFPPANFTFYTGTDDPGWLAREPVRWFVSRSRFIRNGRIPRTFPRAIFPWAYDSGAFSEILKHGRWTIDARRFARQTRIIFDAVGRMEWAAIQDWMCEPDMLRKTGLDVAEHQRRTLANYLELRSIDPELPYIPILQGFEPDDYRRHVDAYLSAGVDLFRLPVVGIGSICRRTRTVAVEPFIREVAGLGMKLHGFGLKIQALIDHDLWRVLHSSDSMAWSFRARRRPPLRPECVGVRRNCSHCIHAALQYRRWVHDGIFQNN